MASNNILETAGDVEDAIQVLLKKPSVKYLLDHHRAVIQKNEIDTIACELLTLTQGVAWDTDSVSFLSASVERPNGNKDYRHALSLGHWLGSLQIVINEQGFSSTDAANWFTKLLGSLTQLKPGRDMNPFRELTREIAKGRITLNEAVELLAYGNVTTSSVTTVIGQGIRAVQRRNLP